MLVNQSVWVLGTKLGLLEEQCVLLAPNPLFEPLQDYLGSCSRCCNNNRVVQCSYKEPAWTWDSNLVSNPSSSFY